MSNHTKEIILAKALELTPLERAEIIEGLLSSFERSSNKEVHEDWAKEAEERIEAYERGKISAKSAQEVFDTINKNL